MNNSWKTFIENKGANFSNEFVSDFGDSTRELKTIAQSNCMAELSHLASIKVSGDDAIEFLQGQFSNDIQQVTDSRSQLSAYCTPKGRMLAILRIQKYGDHTLLTLPTELRDSIISRLQMYILRSKVAIEPADDLIHIGITGPEASAIIETHFGSSPIEVDECIASSNIIITRLQGSLPRFEFIGPESEIEKLWVTLGTDSELSPVGPPAWRWQDIVSGIPVVMPGTSEAFIPQMTNLDVLNGINFKKGCYPGQEIVARTRYLGKLKQRMVRARIRPETLPEPGAPLYAPDFPNQSAGKVVAAERAPDGTCDLLIVAQLSSIKNGVITLGKEDGVALELVPLPYDLPSDIKD